MEEKKTAKYDIHEDLIYFINGENKHLYLTKGIIYDIIDECYGMYTHISHLKVIKMLRDFFYYLKMAKIVRRRLAACDFFQRNKITNQTCFSEMKNYVCTKPNEILLIDFYGPLSASIEGFKYI